MTSLRIETKADDFALVAAEQFAATIIIKAPRQMGKSSLLKRYLVACRQAGKKTALLDLASFTDEEMADYPTFLTVIAQEMWEQFGQPQRATPPRLTNPREMIKYVQKSLLDVIDENVVVAFDEMDRALGRSYQDNFFSTLRYLHDHCTDSPPTGLARLGLAGAISTEPYLFIKDLFRSPFNVGLNIGLRNFNEVECRELNRLYGARLTKAELGRLMALLNGHPHLTHLAFYSIRARRHLS